MHKNNSFIDEFDYALSPLREAAAYEALWLESKASFKFIAENYLKAITKTPPHYLRPIYR